jgi:iron-sulfur cluster assembly protein
MLTITERAVAQIRTAAGQGGMEGMALRIAARRGGDGSIEYAMGFDEAQPGDTRIEVAGLEVVVAVTSAELLQNAVLDYVELEPGEYRFIFLNPNDPHYVAPRGEAR